MHTDIFSNVSFPREDHQIADEKSRLVRLKQEFLVLLEHAAKYSPSPTIEMTSDYIGVEEAFDDLINAEWAALCEEDGVHDSLPVSDHRLKWLKSFRPQPTRGSAPTNPATLAATGDL